MFGYIVKKLTKYFNNEDKKRLLSNFFSLSILQGANYIIPLITLPYLVRVLGPEKFGLIAFAQAFIQYFNILTDYGFNLSATREISIHRENKEKITEIFSSVMIIKLCLLIISFVIMSIIVFSFEKFRKDWVVYYLTFGIVVGQALFPIWFFQGMEKMKYITFLNILAKFIFAIAIFIFIHESSDYIYVPLINSSGFIVAGVLALWIVFKNFNIFFKTVKLENLIHFLKKGWYIFIANLTGNLYGQGTVFILGLVSTENIVGYYSAVERLMKAFSSLTQPFAQAIYPYIVKIKNKSDLKRNFNTVIINFTILSLLFSTLIFVNAEGILKIIYGYNLVLATLTFKLLIIVMFFTILNVIKQPYIYALDMDYLNLKLYIFVGLSFIPLCFVLSKFYGAIGTAFSLLYVEIIIFFLGLFIIKKGFEYEKK